MWGSQKVVRKVDLLAVYSVAWRVSMMDLWLVVVRAERLVESSVVSMADCSVAKMAGKSAAMKADCWAWTKAAPKASRKVAQ